VARVNVWPPRQPERWYAPGFADPWFQNSLTILLSQTTGSPKSPPFSTATMVSPNLLGRAALTEQQKMAQFQAKLKLCGVSDAGLRFFDRQDLKTADDLVTLPLDTGVRDLMKIATQIYDNVGTAGFPPSPAARTAPTGTTAAPAPAPAAADPTAVAAAAAAAVKGKGFEISMKAWANIKALHGYTTFLMQRGQALDYQDFDRDKLLLWLEYMREVYKCENKGTPKDPPKLTDLEDWFTFKEDIYA